MAAREPLTPEVTASSRSSRIDLPYSERYDIRDRLHQVRSMRNDG